MVSKKRSSRPTGSPRTGRAPDGPALRSSGVKVAAPAAAALRAGHPWVFKDALLRPLAVETGQVIGVADEDGHRLGWGLADKDATVAVRMLGHGPKREFDAAEVRGRVESAFKRRSLWLGDALQDTRRLIHGEGDGLPGFAVDKLGDYLVAYKYAECTEAWLESALDAVFEISGAKGIYLQDRTRSVSAEERRPKAELVRGAVAPTEYEVEEDGLRYVVDPSAPVSPGLFLDLREGRRLAQQWSSGRRVLNLFSFTGAFALRALRGGATEVVNVDSAARSHAKCRQNLVASGLDSEAVDAVVGDVFKHLERFRQRERSFDFIVVDPPPFSNVDGNVFSALRHWQELIEAVAGVAAPGAVVLAVCNAAGLAESDFVNSVGRGAAAARRAVRIVSELGLPPDFPVPPAFTEGRYLKVKLLAFG